MINSNPLAHVRLDENLECKTAKELTGDTEELQSARQAKSGKIFRHKCSQETTGKLGSCAKYNG